MSDTTMEQEIVTRDNIDLLGSRDIIMGCLHEPQCDAAHTLFVGKNHYYLNGTEIEKTLFDRLCDEVTAWRTK